MINLRAGYVRVRDSLAAVVNVPCGRLGRRRPGRLPHFVTL